MVSTLSVERMGPQIEIFRSSQSLGMAIWIAAVIHPTLSDLGRKTTS